MPDDTPQPLSYQTAYQSRPPNDRKGGLIGFGIVTIVLGALSGCMGLLSPMALMIPMPPGQPHMRIGVIVSGALLYLLSATALLWVGIGSVRGRRWVRPVILATAVQILVIGVLMTIAMGVMFPKLVIAAVPAGSKQAPVGMAAGIAAGLVMLFIGFVVIPGAYVLFYRSQHVRTTLEFDDPTARWTDDLPIPVLGITLAMLGWCAMELIAMPTAILPAFGTVLHGLPAILVNIVFAAIALLLARLTYRRHPAGWWGTLAFTLVYVISTESTNLRGDLVQLYANAGYSQAELDAIQQFNGGGLSGIIVGFAFLVICVAYMLWVRKYYFRPQVVEVSIP